MPKPIHITAPPLSYQEIVRRLRIPKKRRTELEAIVEQALAERQTRKEATRNSGDLEESSKSAPAA
jgi:hypothetical protein